jgi:hypothetical protein
MRAIPRALVLRLAALPASCAPAGTGGPGRSSDPITAEEIQANPSPDTYAPIRKLHPAWLRGRGVTSIRDPLAANSIVVYLDETRCGRLERLRQLSTTGIRAIRYLSPACACWATRTPAWSGS